MVLRGWQKGVALTVQGWDLQGLWKERGCPNSCLQRSLKLHLWMEKNLVRTNKEQEDSPLSPPHPFFAESLTEPGAHGLATLAGQQAQGILCLCFPSTGVVVTDAIPSFFFMRVRVSKLWSSCLRTNTLTTKPSPCPVFFKKKKVSAQC